jgi:hypothetical protein
LKYWDVHQELDFWKNMRMDALAGELMEEDRRIMEAYN